MDITNIFSTNFSSLTGLTEIRIYGWNSAGPGGTMRLTGVPTNNALGLYVTGTTAAVPGCLPQP